MLYVAEMIPKLKTRTQKAGGGDPSLQQGEGSKKGKGKKKKWPGVSSSTWRHRKGHELEASNLNLRGISFLPASFNGTVSISASIFIIKLDIEISVCWKFVSSFYAVFKKEFFVLQRKFFVERRIFLNGQWTVPWVTWNPIFLCPLCKRVSGGLVRSEIHFIHLLS